MISKKKVSVAIIAAAVVAVCAVSAHNRINNDPPCVPVGYEQIRLERGDTLWGVAEIYCPSRMDKRAYISRVQKINGISANVCAGDIITVPVYDE